MGCNCRKVKKIHKMLTGEEHSPGILARIIQGLMVLVVFSIAMPFILIYLYINYVINGNFTIKIPNLLKK